MKFSIVQYNLNTSGEFSVEVKCKEWLSNRTSLIKCGVDEQWDMDIIQLCAGEHNSIINSTTAVSSKV